MFMSTADVYTYFRECFFPTYFFRLVDPEEDSVVSEVASMDVEICYNRISDLWQLWCCSIVAALIQQDYSKWRVTLLYWEEFCTEYEFEVKNVGFGVQGPDFRKL